MNSKRRKKKRKKKKKGSLELHAIGKINECRGKIQVYDMSIKSKIYLRSWETRVTLGTNNEKKKIIMRRKNFQGNAIIRKEDI